MNQPTWQDLPKKIQEEMLNEQERQGNKRDAGVFEKNILATKYERGFNWDETKSICLYGWKDILEKGNFTPFYEKFPKKDPDTIAWDEPVEMLVWDDRKENAKSRMVHGKFKGRFVVYYTSNDDYNIYKNAKQIIPTINWDEFKEGDVVEVVNVFSEKFVFYFVRIDEDEDVHFSSRCNNQNKNTPIMSKSNVKSIRKLK